MSSLEGTLSQSYILNDSLKKKLDTNTLKPEDMSMYIYSYQKMSYVYKNFGSDALYVVMENISVQLSSMYSGNHVSEEKVVQLKEALVVCDDLIKMYLGSVSDYGLGMLDWYEADYQEVYLQHVRDAYGR